MEIQIEKQYRCKGYLKGGSPCLRFLGAGKVKGKISIVCPRCGHYNTFRETENKVKEKVN